MTYAALLDDAGIAQQLTNLRLSAEFATLQKECDALPTQGNIAAALRRLAIGKRIREIIIALGVAVHPSTTEPQVPETTPSRPSTAHLYAFDQHRKPAFLQPQFVAPPAEFRVSKKISKFKLHTI